MTKLILYFQLFGGVLFLLFCAFNAIRGVLQGDFFPIMMFGFMGYLSLAYVSETLKDLKRDN